VLRHCGGRDHHECYPYLLHLRSNDQPNFS
jgi:hypothetical protein